MRGEKATRPCAACGQALTRYLSQARGKHWYCGPSCQAAHAPHPITVARDPNPLRGQQETRPCAVCSKPVTRYLSQVRAKIHDWTCSRSCAATLRGRVQRAAGTWKRPQKSRRGDTIPCSVCEKPFYRQPAYAKQGRHLCSPECNRIWQTKPATVKLCARCGTQMMLKPSQAGRLYCSRICDTAAKTKRPTGRVHNGKPVLMNAAGYLTVYEPSHPAAARNGRVLEHRFVMEKMLMRRLRSDEHVDHIDQDKTNNRLDNLQVLSPADHSRKTNGDKERAKAKLLAEVAAYRKKYGELPLE